MNGTNVMFGDSDEWIEVDTIVWCTGYNKTISYIGDSCGVNFLHDGYVIDPLYLHFININHPTMAILHLTSGNVPFPQIDVEVRCFLSLHQKRIMPELIEMMTWLENDINWRNSLNIPTRHRHKMIGGRIIHWQRHMSELAKVSKIEPLPDIYGDMLLYTFSLILVRGLPKARSVQFSVDQNKTEFHTASTDVLVDILYWILKILIYIGVLK